ALITAVCWRGRRLSAIRQRPTRLWRVRMIGPSCCRPDAPDVRSSVSHGSAAAPMTMGCSVLRITTVNGALCLLHTSHTPPEGLLEKTESVLAQACGERM